MFGEGDDYRFDPQHLTHAHTDLRRWCVIYISKNRLVQYENALLDLLETERDVSNQRHIVRGLGNIGSARSVEPLLRHLCQGQGLILGDVAEALGKLNVRDARPEIERLTQSEVCWVAEKARWALRQLD
jgi:hypothetical protein